MLIERIAMLEARIAVLEGKLINFNAVPPTPIIGPITTTFPPVFVPIPQHQFAPPYIITSKAENDK